MLSDGSTAQAMTDQGVQVTQGIEADAIATGIQDSTIDQSDTIEGGTGGIGDGAQPEAGAQPMLMSAAPESGEVADAADAAAAAATVRSTAAW